MTKDWPVNKHSSRCDQVGGPLSEHRTTLRAVDESVSIG